MAASQVLTRHSAVYCSSSEIITPQSFLNWNGSSPTRTCTSRLFESWLTMRYAVKLQSPSGFTCIHWLLHHKDPTRADLKEIPPAVVMSVLMAATTSTGQKLSDSGWQSVERACDLADRLEKVRTKVRALSNLLRCRRTGSPPS